MMQNTSSRKLQEERVAASIDCLEQPAPAPVDIDALAALIHRLDCIRCRMTWCCGGISTDDQDRARDVAQWPEYAALLAAPADTGHTPTEARSVVEYGVERSLPQVNNGEPYIEWCASTGITHRYEYTAESVWGLAGGRPVWQRTRTSWPDRLSAPTIAVRPAPASATETEGGAQ